MAEQWMIAARKPEPMAQVRVERHPALASADQGRYQGLDEPSEIRVLGESFRLDQLPYLLAFSGDKPLGAVSLALYGDDLLLLGFERQPDLGLPGVCAAILDEALAVGREIGRGRLLAPLTNADALPFFFLQAEGFALVEVKPYDGPQRQGLGGILATHELLLERVIG
jgi:hypothetical protein